MCLKVTEEIRAGDHRCAVSDVCVSSADDTSDLLPLFEFDLQTRQHSPMIIKNQT